MKKAILFISILFTSIINGYGQKNELLLRSKVTGEETVIEDGKYLKIVCKNGLVFRGNLKMMDTSILSSDTLIVIDTKKIKVNEIDAIRLISWNENPVGSSMTGVGGCLAIAGLLRNVTALSGFSGIVEAGGGIALIIIGVPVVIVGVVILISGKKYSSVDWDISIRAK